VEQTIRVGEFTLHIGQVEQGTLHVGDHIESAVDAARRERIKRNHTATHLLNLALRSIAGPRSDQRGSLVAPDRLRFDYAADRPLKPDELAAIERHVCDRIEQDLQVHADVVPLDGAKSIQTARAIFGEQYPDPVRVLSIGTPVADLLSHPDDGKFDETSVEFCGGTHLGSTGEAQDFVLLSEQGLAAGIRRVVAVTGEEAKAARAEADSIAGRMKELDSLEEEQLPEAVEGLNSSFETAAIGAVDRATLSGELDALRKRAKKARKQAQSASKGEMIERARAIASESTGPFVVARLDGADRDGLLAALDTIRGNSEDVAVLLLAADEEAGKVVIVSRVPDSLIDQGLKAGDWVKVAAQACGGGGGGRADSAQAGGKDPARADDALKAARSYAESTL
jgi:alanyl-tRNA synthetase